MSSVSAKRKIESWGLGDEPVQPVQQQELRVLDDYDNNRDDRSVSSLTTLNNSALEDFLSSEENSLSGEHDDVEFVGAFAGTEAGNQKKIKREHEEVAVVLVNDEEEASDSDDEDEALAECTKLVPYLNLVNKGIQEMAMALQSAPERSKDFILRHKFVLRGIQEELKEVTGVETRNKVQPCLTCSVRSFELSSFRNSSSTQGSSSSSTQGSSSSSSSSAALTDAQFSERIAFVSHNLLDHQARLHLIQPKDELTSALQDQVEEYHLNCLIDLALV
ncbi:Hypothetical Protein FCC1311_112162 [Hondaea fermentalgiana]|uniref:Uncharacterized protein n=1 Tax=Hondaea fermentalgiana TaxID=2315210 RepID=A0A2R5H3K0_9STRA|nr:Hypothetical Protein FCC1311_112162 [Hondaea fermentalgiana]|eukprot:GBG34994.1 Hypothetical Protein FCC1311_112162 [Hondaea fermentalgiana]